MNPNFQITGLEKPIDISANEVNLFVNMRKFEEFICCHKKNKNIISNLFVFYLITLNGVNSKPIPIYLKSIIKV